MQPEDAYFQVNDNDFYASQKHKSLLKKQTTCEHKFFVCRCSLCNKVLGSEKTIKL
jgi:hypothetical protein